jgi:CDP-paratose 2-epimerase
MGYLVTGGCGFLGSNIANELLSMKEEVYVFDNLSRVGASENLSWLEGKPGFTFVYGDIRNSNDVETLIAKVKPKVVFHLAGQVAMTSSIANPRMDFEVNALGSVNVLEACRVHCPEATILYSSTNKVYGDLEQYTYSEEMTRYACVECPNGFDENTQLNFQSPYGVSKGSADQYMLDYHKMYGLNTVVFRHSSMFGGRQFATFDQGWVGWFVKQALDTKSSPDTRFTVSGSGKQVRDLLFIDDCIRLYLDAAHSPTDLAGRAFNIGGGYENSSSVLELFSILEQELSVVLNYDLLPTRPSDQKVFIADITSIQKDLLWKPNVNREVGIERMISWMARYN